MHTRKTILAVLVAGAVLGSGGVSAENSGWYVGAGVGQSSVDISGSEVDALTAAEGLTSTTSVDDTDTAWKLFGGYRLTENFGIETAYMDYGSITSDTTVTAPVAGTINIDLETTAWIIDAVGILPLNEQFELFGKLGVAMWDIEADVSAVAGGTAFGGSVEDDGSDFHFGVGAGYALTDTIGIRAEWERVNGDDDLDAWTVGAQFGF
ncbi:MAG TPA: outer membrane beta-barrel protein [Gammaproteobacteria bacterium]